MSRRSVIELTTEIHQLGLLLGRGSMMSSRGWLDGRAAERMLVRLSQPQSSAEHVDSIGSRVVQVLLQMRRRALRRPETSCWPDRRAIDRRLLGHLDILFFTRPWDTPNTQGHERKSCCMSVAGLHSVDLGGHNTTVAEINLFKQDGSMLAH